MARWSWSGGMRTAAGASGSGSLSSSGSGCMARRGAKVVRPAPPALKVGRLAGWLAWSTAPSKCNFKLAPAGWVCRVSSVVRVVLSKLTSRIDRRRGTGRYFDYSTDDQICART